MWYLPKRFKAVQFAGMCQSINSGIFPVRLVTVTGFVLCKVGTDLSSEFYNEVVSVLVMWEDSLGHNIKNCRHDVWRRVLRNKCCGIVLPGIAEEGVAVRMFFLATQFYCILSSTTPTLPDIRFPAMKIFLALLRMCFRNITAHNIFQPLPPPPPQMGLISLNGKYIVGVEDWLY